VAGRYRKFYGAIHYSTQKQKWRFDVENLLQQHRLISRYGSNVPNEFWDIARKNAAASIALLWKLMIRINTTLAKENSHILMVTHESLCMQPMEMATIICNHFQLPFTAQLKSFVSDHSCGNRVEAEDGKTHDFKRDSKAIPNAWRGKVTLEEEMMIQEIAGDEIMAVYGR
jgi:hypothetical protein